MLVQTRDSSRNKDAIEVENYEAVDMYPRFIEISIEEGLVNVTQSFQ